MPLHPQVRTLLDQMAAVGGKTMSESTPEEGRQAMQMLAMLGGEGPAVETVEDRVVEGVPCRFYRPAVPAGAAGLPLLVWYHGGGWVIGDLETADPTCRELAVRAQCAVLSVDYRLAPEAPFPAGVDDAWTVLSWVASSAGAAALGVDVGRVAVGGDSAGGNLAAVVAQKAAAEGLGLAFQLLVYPVTDLRFGHPSMEENAEGYLLTRDTMVWFRGHYLANEADVLNPLASPLLADDASLAGVAPALVITAEFDPLRDEGEAYARKLEAAGVPVKLTRYDGQIHGFFGLAALLDDTPRALDEAGAALRSAF